MNYKLLFPTYRNRFRFVRESFNGLLSERSGKKFERGLSLGTGEGDYDALIAAYCNQLVGCDINKDDMEFAKSLNQDVSNLSYQVENALELTFPNESFDMVISMEVIEHVGKPWTMMQEIHRVLKPGGKLVMTFPSTKFPITYDPIHRIKSVFSPGKWIRLGAYDFGHDYLIDPKEYQEKVKELGFKIENRMNLSGYLIGQLEMYWTGLAQRIFKSNKGNLDNASKGIFALRPDRKEPKAVFLTDAIINVDRTLFSKSGYSHGQGFILTKN
jgi:ubiquinone/menaquinone biosynthesis C-methylase UbiE